MENHTNPIIIELNMKQIAKVNLWATLLLSVLFIIANGLIHQHLTITITFWSFLIFIIGYIFLIVLHEIFHLIGFVIFGKVKIKELDYGVNLKLGVAYATTTKPLKNSAMKKALLLPLWTTGVLPTILGIIIDSNLVVLLGAFLIAGAAGDIYMYKELLKFPKNALIKDDPNLPRLYVYTDTNK
ncbi:hypothetical protein CD30_02830 [Ureibacillus massiliensis 4400831 = CIP 108448 = CCUG 49529]|uniref:Diaminopimelate epimerase n=1 Tax=Ureibacillus massiliensis 4400831 = CIP 108448 = CCUG 49529 TaxID=1211035 RepID=A0A0A3J4L7_9BACL|nr:DUF3267 domain-containing protein [Ureibacillus massiliensis]KGR91861.1 hypothetical protein CD30_02830 [Ureibacillus massiliensis 4400831 = CIP 108448 = CCUG 49529]